ncbi:MAG: hypothetical protein II892_04930 [Fibrobacter sp.]|nr:hypothetical protein [Fibrobacter sp.]
MNYSGIAKQMVCKAAVLLALALIACSEDGKSIADGGTAEERGLQANNNSDAAHNRYTVSGRAMRMVNPSADTIYMANSFDTYSSMQGSFVPYGSVLRLSELDSLTLDTTGVFYFTRCTDTTGNFSFDSVSLNSPYVLVELLPYIYDDWQWNLTNKEDLTNLKDFSDTISYGQYLNNNYNALVDLRTADNIGLNIMTRLEASRIKHLFKNGTDFATAKQQADQEVLEAVGIYNGTFNFDKSDFAQDTNKVFIANIVYDAIFRSRPIYSVATDYTAPSVNTFGETGTFTADDSVKADLLRYFHRWFLFDAGYVDNSKNAFMTGFFATIYGLGECTTAREGDTVETAGTEDQYLNLICQSGAWVAEGGRHKIVDKVNFETGTMTDDRDGKTYKTVTYDIEGNPLTWMAENLTYSNDSIQPVMELDSMMVKYYRGGKVRSGIYEGENFGSYANSLDSSYWNTFAQYSVHDVIGADTIVMEGEHLQGICPNGWHIPTQQEWSSLMRLLEYASEYCPGYRGCEEFKENNGFGWYSSRFLHVVGFGDFTVEPFVFIQQDDNGTWSTFVILMDNWKGYTYTANEVSGLLSVRCVKD